MTTKIFNRPWTTEGKQLIALIQGYWRRVYRTFSISIREVFLKEIRSIVQPRFNTHSKTFEIIPLLPQPFIKIMQHVLLNLHQFQKNHPGLSTLHYLITSFDPKLKHSKLLSLQLEQTISPLYVLFTTVLKVYIDYGWHPCNCEPYNALCDIQTDLYLWIFRYA